ncbi:hypothetical protein SAMN05877753_102416 [Bacillus oleivorans]|uniref:Uncharacterized protein n=1 Tax=Bacillus oleivorans TaxID=1448271 RepID=A0A285CMF7_9BACI|nr:DUF6123 family protein [Bacillus oleivorans]SNX68216.1 hypothetical protein SAMN05877753_102416 [Bacillus oleivorans]
MRTAGEYIAFLQSKGFKLGEDAIAFIFFGKQFAKASDQLVIWALESTLKMKQSFDGSFYLLLLERLVEENIQDKRGLVTFMKENGFYV